MKRACGVLLPISSLPGNYGIGSFSKEAYSFVDKLKQSGQSYWQILPLGPTGYGDSPYQSCTAFAGNMNYIDLDTLVEEGLLTVEELNQTQWYGHINYVDYGRIWENREGTLRKAFFRFKKNLDQKGCEEFVQGVKGLPEETIDYCIYQAIKDDQKLIPWYEWEDDLKLRKPDAMSETCERLADTIEFYEWCQLKFNEQWQKLRKYAKEAGVSIIGDMPIYVAWDSAESWAHPELFDFDEKLDPIEVAGCPPDYFSPDGQFWGNPLYKWDDHEKNGYEWWMHRMKYALSLYDYVRIDHFRGFDEYYAIPAKDENARNGSWKQGPGLKLFDKMRTCFAEEYPDGNLPIIAEDLGLLTPSVIKLVQDSGFPGMKVLEFSYDSDNKNLYLPHNYERNCVAYTGTHDNAPLRAWLDGLNDGVKQHMISYQGSEHTPYEDLHWDCIRTILESVADTVIIPMHDYMGLGKEARINEPGTFGDNWKWRMSEGFFSDELVWHIKMLADLYARD